MPRQRHEKAGSGMWGWEIENENGVVGGSQDP